jgi:hypothetical protein
MEQFRQRMNERIKTQLKATDEEWAVIQPLLENVQTKMRETMMSRFAGMAGGAGGAPRRGPAGEAPGASPAAGAADRPERRAQRPVSTESADLRAALENDQTSNTDIKAKLEALRASRKRGEDELAQARADLKKVLSLRQEATLVMMGMLD